MNLVTAGVDQWIWLAFGVQAFLYHGRVEVPLTGAVVASTIISAMLSMVTAVARMEYVARDGNTVETAGELESMPAYNLFFVKKS